MHRANAIAAIVALMVLPAVLAPTSEAGWNSPCTIVHEETRGGNAWYAVRFRISAYERAAFVVTGSGQGPVAVTSWLTSGWSTPVGPAFVGVFGDPQWTGSSVHALDTPVVDLNVASSGSSESFTILFDYYFLNLASTREFVAVIAVAGDPVTTSTFRHCTTIALQPVSTTSGAGASRSFEDTFEGDVNVRSTAAGNYVAYARDVARTATPSPGHGLFAAFLPVDTSIARQVSVRGPTGTLPSQTSYAIHNAAGTWRFQIEEYLETAPSSRTAGHILLTTADVQYPPY